MKIANKDLYSGVGGPQRACCGAGGRQSQNLCSLKIANRIFSAQNRILCPGRNALELIAAVVQLQESGSAIDEITDPV